ncbi:MAG: hypothetical protein HKN36_08205 [Hellea sp.]|nr:hypothetical protein [Hellea sp.]
MNNRYHRYIGGMIALWAGMVMIAWKVDFTVIIGIPPGAVPMQFNTALCFLGLGLSKMWQSRGPLAGVLIVALPTLAQDLTGINFGIDELFHPDPRLTAETPVPGRMSPAAGLFFSVLSLSGLLYYRWPEVTSWAFSFVFAASIVFIVSYIGVLPNIYQVSDETTSIALTTAILFALYSGTALWQQVGAPDPA